MALPDSQEQVRAKLRAMIGKKVGVRYGEHGGEGVLAEINMHNGELELVLDYGYSFTLMPETTVEIVEGDDDAAD